MAELINRVSNMPEAPTSVPATMRRLLSSTNPEAATASPGERVYSEISDALAHRPRPRAGRR